MDNRGVRFRFPTRVDTSQFPEQTLILLSYLLLACWLAIQQKLGEVHYSETSVKYRPTWHRNSEHRILVINCCGENQIKKKKKKKKSVNFSPQAVYTDRVAAALQRSYCQLLRIEGVAWSAQRILTAVNLGFLYPEPLLYHWSSSSVIYTRMSGPRSRPTTSQKMW
jgi:hypothetical protein